MRRRPSHHQPGPPRRHPRSRLCQCRPLLAMSCCSLRPRGGAEEVAARWGLGSISAHSTPRALAGPLPSLPHKCPLLTAQGPGCPAQLLPGQYPGWVPGPRAVALAEDEPAPKLQGAPGPQTAHPGALAGAPGPACTLTLLSEDWFTDAATHSSSSRTGLTRADQGPEGAAHRLRGGARGRRPPSGCLLCARRPLWGQR